MKKLLIIALIFAVLAISGGIYWKRTRTPFVSRGAELAPADAIFFAHLPNLHRTQQRWKFTALSQLWHEPEMQAFLEKPIAKMNAETSWVAQFERWQGLEISEAFLAVTSIDGPEPRFVAGFSFAGSAAQVEALLEEPRAALKKARPTGRAELVNYGAAEIETFTEKEATMAGVVRDNWYFLANSLELLEQTLDRYDHKNDVATGGLGSSASFVAATAPLPADPDGMMVAQLGTVMDRLGALMQASGQTLDEKQLMELQKTKSVAVATKLEGTNFRDTIFVLSEGGKAEPPLTQNALALTSPATLLYFAMTLPATLELPDSSAAMLTLLLPNLAAMKESLATNGLTFADWNKAFGPEFGAVLDWPAETLQPSFLLTFDVRETAKAQAFAEALTGPSPGGRGWLKKEEGGAVIYAAPPSEGLSFVSPTLALTERFLVAGLSPEAVAPVGARLKAGEPTLTGDPAFASAAKGLAPATSSYVYVDLRGLVERAYGTFRPFIIMSLAFAPDAGPWIDGGKLPSTETFTKHLGPIVMSQSTSEHGTVFESSGTLTINQLLIGAVAGAVRASLPTLQNMQTGGLDPSKLLQLVQPPATPPAPPPALESETGMPPKPLPPMPEAAPAPLPKID